MKAKLKILAKPSSLSQVFRNHLTDYSTRSLNVFETYFDITGQAAKRIQCHLIPQNRYFHEELKQDHGRKAEQHKGHTEIIENGIIVQL